MVTITLSGEDASFLRQQLARQAEHVQDELAHTEAFNMQRELAADLKHLEGLLARIDGATTGSGAWSDMAAGEQRPPDDS